MPLCHHFHESQGNRRINLSKPSLALIRRSLRFSGVSAVGEEEVSRGASGGAGETRQGSGTVDHPESWRVFWSYPPGLICATTQGKRAPKNRQPREGGVRPPNPAPSSGSRSWPLWRHSSSSRSIFLTFWPHSDPAG